MALRAQKPRYLFQQFHAKLIAARMATETLFKSVPCLRWECLIFDREWTSENDA